MAKNNGVRKPTLALVLVFALAATMLAGCDFPEPKEQPHLYWKDIDVVVTDTEKKHWFATVPRYEVELTVESPEYGLERSFTYTGSGMFGCPSQWDYEEGDIVRAKLYSWVMDSTGEVTERRIAEVY